MVDGVILIGVMRSPVFEDNGKGKVIGPVNYGAIRVGRNACVDGCGGRNALETVNTLFLEGKALGLGQVPAKPKVNGVYKHSGGICRPRKVWQRKSWVAGEV